MSYPLFSAAVSRILNLRCTVGLDSAVSTFRRWKGDYLGDTVDNPDYSLYRAALTKENVIGPKKVLFSTLVYKFNRLGKVHSRAVVFTAEGSRVLKMDNTKKYKLMDSFTLNDVTGISIRLVRATQQMLLEKFQKVNYHFSPNRK